MSLSKDPIPSSGRLVRVQDTLGRQWLAKVTVLGPSELFLTSDVPLLAGAPLELDLDGTSAEAEVAVPAVDPQGAYVRLDNVVLLDVPADDLQPTEDMGALDFSSEFEDETSEPTVTILLGDEFESTIPGTPGQTTGGGSDGAPTPSDGGGFYPQMDLTEGTLRFDSGAAFASHYDEYLKSGSLVAIGPRLRRGRVYGLSLEVPGHEAVELWLRVVAAMSGRVGFLLTDVEQVLPKLKSLLER